MKRPFKALLRGLVGLALLGAVVALADPSRVWGQLRQAQPGWLLAGLLAGIASNLVSALRWRALARWLGANASARDACRWYFQAIGLNALLPGAVVGGDVYRAVVLRGAGQVERQRLRRRRAVGGRHAELELAERCGRLVGPSGVSAAKRFPSDSRSAQSGCPHPRCPLSPRQHCPGCSCRR